MKLDEFAFFNQQLASMLREGIPLEGALRQLTSTMQEGELRTELQALEKDLARGTPLAQAAEARRLPPLYRRMLAVGARGQDLPGFLTRMADHYHEQHLTWTRLKGLMTYPLMVLTAIFGLSLFVHFFLVRIYYESTGELIHGVMDGVNLPAATQFSLPLVEHSWVFPAFFGLLLVVAVAVGCLENWRDALLWRLPAFREAALARLANTLAMLLERQVPMPEAVSLVAELEQNPEAALEIRGWQERLAQGVTDLSQVTAGGRFIPPLFSWLASNAGAHLAEGFRRTAEVYRARAMARTEIMMQAALPVTILTLGSLVALQAILLLLLFLPFVTLLNNLG